MSNAIPPSNIFYAEYQNTGPGARVNKRVTWPGYKANITADQANKFTVEYFVEGSEWLSLANVVFDSSL